MKENYILCPVCSKHKFPAWEDNGTCVCPHCGWAHDSLSEEEHFETGSHNDLCLDDYKLRYEYYVEQNPNYHWARDKFPEIPQIEPTDCPVCGKYEFEDKYCHDICSYCGWEDDGCDEDNEIGTNYMSFSDYKNQYEEHISANPKYKWEKDGNP